MSTDFNHEQHLTNLEQLVSTRTEQLRQVLSEKEQLLECVKQLQSMGSLEQMKEAVQAAITRFETKESPQKFGGEPGEPVPEVDAEDVKAVWKIQSDLQARHPGEQVATGMGLLQAACKPGANIEAISYRASQLFLMSFYAPEHLEKMTANGQPSDSVFSAVAKMPMEWMGVGIVRQGPPFNFDEFLHLCGLN